MVGELVADGAETRRGEQRALKRAQPSGAQHDVVDFLVFYRLGERVAGGLALAAPNHHALHARLREVTQDELRAVMVQRALALRLRVARHARGHGTGRRLRHSAVKVHEPGLADQQRPPCGA